MLFKRNGYNEHGSMAAMPHLENMQWDFAERMSHVTKGTTKAYYNYDGSGERVRKVVEKENGTLKLERETLHVMDGYSEPQAGSRHALP